MPSTTTDHTMKTAPFAPRVCPICKRLPKVDRFTGWRKKLGGPPWYAACYRMHTDDHYIGAAGKDRAEAIKNWNAEVKKHGAKA